MVNNRRSFIYFPIFIAVAVIAGMFLGRYYKNLHTAEDRFYIYPRIDKLSSVLNYIEREYVDPVSRTELEEKTIPKILEGLDPHSQYIPASELQSVNEPLEGNFSGIGIQFNMLNDTLVVINTISNGPSEKVGVLPGDRIIMVDNDTVAGIKMPSDSIVKRLKGPKNTSVSVEIMRRNVEDLIPFVIVRDNIPLYSVDVDYMINDEIGYIKLNKFSRTTFEEFITAYNRLKSKGLKKLVLDLRNNGGGIMDAAVNIADQFLGGEEMIVYTQGNSKGRTEYRSNQGGLCTDSEVIILIDEGTASASEILAGAIQDNDRSMIIGRRSFGKGLVQDQRQFSDGSAIRLTIARYYTPTGRCIQKPYNHGLADYYNDINNRYLNGEFESKDSIHFDDSLRYTTPKGKVVYGGGGIMPDIFVPIDTSGVTDYLIHIRNKGLIYRFALRFADNHRNKLEQNSTPEGIVNYLDKSKVLAQFKKYVRQEGISSTQSEIKRSEEILRIQLYAYIARNIIDNNGFYPIIEEIDNTLQRAINEFEQEDLQVSENVSQ